MLFSTSSGRWYTGGCRGSRSRVPPSGLSGSSSWLDKRTRGNFGPLFWFEPEPPPPSPFSPPVPPSAPLPPPPPPPPPSPPCSPPPPDPPVDLPTPQPP